MKGLLGPALASPMFVLVQALASASTAVGLVEERPSPASVSRSVVAPGLIEIELGDGRHFRVGSDVNLAALRRMLGGVARVIPIASSVRISTAGATPSSACLDASGTPGGSPRE